MLRRLAAGTGVLLMVVTIGPSARAQGRATAPPASATQARTASAHITTPMEAFGHDFGEDYFLANYKQISSYWHTLEKESPRIHVQSIGKTSEGRDQLMAIVTSPANYASLARYKSISDQLAHARGTDGAVLTDAQARALAREGKTVVWIDGGLHASEVLGAQQLGEMVYRMVSKTDEETMRILNDCIILFVHANPDGNDLVADWYMRNPDPLQRSQAGLPRLWQKYIGHDNNRDSFASTQMETKNMNRVQFRDWFPQILYNHHQSGPAGTILYSPPLRDPFNYNEDPLVVLGIEQIGNALHTRLAAENKPGATMRSGGPYDGWWNGGVRNTAVFHNSIAILTEMIGDPTPMRVALVMDRQLPTADLAMPIAPQEWHFRQSIEYSVSCNLAILDIASRLRENYLYNRYVMGKHSIERGSTDTWTPRPHRMAAIEAAFAGGAGAPASANQGVSGNGAAANQGSGAAGQSVSAPAAGAAASAGQGRGRGASSANDMALWAALHKREDRDPRAFVIPASQRDFPTATKFVNALLENGIDVMRATREFAVNGKSYPKDSFVVFTAQAFRPHVMDMFEPQDHPDNFPVPGGPPQHPYDNAGWTLAFQMGVEFDRVLDGFIPPVGALENAGTWDVKPPAGIVGQPRGGVMQGWYGSTSRLNDVDSAVAVNRLLAAGIPVAYGRPFAGSLMVPITDASKGILDKVAADRGLSFGVADSGAIANLSSLPRIGLWDQYGGSMEAGWARWILEQFEFKFDRVFAPQLDAGNLNAKYDVLVFANGAIPGPGGGGGRRGGGPDPQSIPAEYRDELGSISVDKTLPILKDFVEKGGTVIAIGTSAMNLARFLNLPIENHLVENGAPLPQTKCFVPGSVLQARVDATNSAAFGMQEHTDFFYDNSPVMKLGADAAAKGVKPIAWFDSKTPLRSGWAWGQAYLDGGVIAAEAKVGAGRVLLYTAPILQRGQPHATFKLLFNGIFESVMK
jgi:hypothetical protein